MQDNFQDYINERKEECKHHPFEKQITVEKYRNNLINHAYYFKHVFASAQKLNNYKIFDFLNECDCIEQANGNIEIYTDIVQQKGLKYIYSFYFNDAFESYEIKKEIIQNQNKPKLHMYIYDVELKQEINLFSESYIAASFLILEHTPNEYFEYTIATNEQLNNVLPQSAIDELRQIFLNMVPNHIEVVQRQFDLFELEAIQQLQDAIERDTKKDANEMWQTVIHDIARDEYNGSVELATNDMVQEYGTPQAFKDFCIHESENDLNEYMESLKSLRIIETESNEKQFFDVFLNWYDVLFINKHAMLQSKYVSKEYPNIKSYNDLLSMFIDFSKLEIEEMQKQYDAMPTYNKKITSHQIEIAESEKYYISYNPNVIDDYYTREYFEMLHEEYESISQNVELCKAIEKELLSREIKRKQESLEQEQQKMEDISKRGTPQNYINSTMQHFMEYKPIESGINATNKRTNQFVYLMDPMARNYKNIYDVAIASNGIVKTNKKQHGAFGLIQYDIESIESNKQFNFDYMQLYNAVCSYWLTNTTTPFSTHQLYEILLNKTEIKHPNIDTMQWINNALLEMAKAWFKIEQPIVNTTTSYMREGYFLPIEPIYKNATINGFLYDAEYRSKNPHNMVWHLIKMPLLYEYSEETNKLIYKLERNYLLPTKESNLKAMNITNPTEQTIIAQLIVLIHGIETDYLSKREYVLLDFLSNNCHIDLNLYGGASGKKQKERFKDIIKNYLAIAKENHHITDFEIKKSSKNKNTVSMYITK